MENRRNFLKKAIVGTAAGIAPGILFSNNIKSAERDSQSVFTDHMIWAALLHLSFNMWEDHNRFIGDDNPNLHWRGYEPKLRLSESLWRDCLLNMQKNGLNMVVIDVGDAVKLASCPEIAVENAWDRLRLKQELAYIRSLGLEPIPKFNFSASHDTWFGEYGRMLSTPRYYDACKRLIAEVADLFGKPRFFHLGFDEEVYGHQSRYDYAVVRQNDLWWKDLYFLIDEVEKSGSRAWIWSDYYWSHPDIFLKKMPKNVLQSNWYYKEDFLDLNNKRVKAYIDLEEAGYDQIPTGGYYKGTNGEMFSPNSMMNTVRFCKEKISPSRLFGFMQTNWRPTIEYHRKDILTSIDLVGEAKMNFQT